MVISENAKQLSPMELITIVDIMLLLFRFLATGDRYRAMSCHIFEYLCWHLFKFCMKCIII